MSPDRRAPDPTITNAAAVVTSTIAPTLKLVSRYGLGTLIAVVSVAYLLFMNYRQSVAAKELDPQFQQQLNLQMKQIETTNAMLQRHMDATAINAVVGYLTCVRLTKLTGENSEMCSVPGMGMK